MNRFYFWAFLDKEYLKTNENIFCWLLTKKIAKQFFLSEEEAIEFSKNIDLDQMDLSEGEFLEKFVLRKCFIKNEDMLQFLETLYEGLPIISHPKRFVLKDLS